MQEMLESRLFLSFYGYCSSYWKGVGVCKGELPCIILYTCILPRTDCVSLKPSEECMSASTQEHHKLRDRAAELDGGTIIVSDPEGNPMLQATKPPRGVTRGEYATSTYGSAAYFLS